MFYTFPFWRHSLTYPYYLYLCNHVSWTFPHTKTYHSPHGTIQGSVTEDPAVKTSWDKLFHDLKSWGAGHKPIIQSRILLQCHNDAGAILWGHYSGITLINVGDKIIFVNSFWLVADITKCCRGYVSEHVNVL